jgi:hypothetical protein
MHKSTTAPQTAEALAQQLQAEGFTPGAPQHIRLETVAVDRHACRALKCPGCQRRGCQYRPFGNGRTYRVLACCRHCPAGVEV